MAWKVTEQKSGTVWIAGETGAKRKERELWVLKSSKPDNPVSIAKPGVVGFYSTRATLEKELGNI